jgi:hypothetical protein
LFVHSCTASPTATFGQMGWSNAYGQTIPPMAETI